MESVKNIFRTKNRIRLWLLLPLSLSLLLSASKSIAQTAPATPMLPGGVDALFTKDTNGMLEAGVTKDLSFDKVLKVTSTYPTGAVSVFTLKAPVSSEVVKGDILWLSLRARCLQSKRETGEAFMAILLDRNVKGKYEWPPILERGLSFGKEWTLFQIPVVASRDVKPGDLSLVIKCGTYAEAFELGELQLLNYQKTVSYNKLPRSIVHYDGDSPDATWRKPAAARIEKYRKGNLSVQVVNKSGKPLPDAEITVKMLRSNFHWGTSVNSKLITDSLSPDAEKYRKTLTENYNMAVPENDVKAKYWAKSDHAKTLKALDWLHQQGLQARGHVMVWPSWQHSPHLLQFQHDTAALRTAILNRIAEQTRVLKGQFAEWDVINEPYAHHDIIDLLGRHTMVDWFKAAHAGAPGVRLYLNDYTMFQGEGSSSASEKFFENVLYLKNSRAPINAIGEQGHIGGTPPGIAYIISRLDRFATLGLPIQISEFDITSDDEEFKARYLKDFITAVFSHPSTVGIIQWGFWEKEHWVPAAALWNKDWQLRANGREFTELVHQTFATNTSGLTRANGTYSVRAFNGTYAITAKFGKQLVTKQIELNSEGGQVKFDF